MIRRVLVDSLVKRKPGVVAGRRGGLPFRGRGRPDGSDSRGRPGRARDDHPGHHLRNSHHVRPIFLECEIVPQATEQVPPQVPAGSRESRDPAVDVPLRRHQQLLSGAANDVENVGKQAVSDIENYANQAIGEITDGAEQAIGSIQNFGSQLLSTVANDVQMVESTVTSGLSQIGTAIGNFFPQAAGAVTGAISQLGTAVSGEISQITGQVSGDLQNFVSAVASDAQAAQTDLTTAFNTASSTFTSAFEQFGSDLETTFTSPAVEAGLSLLARRADDHRRRRPLTSEVFDGPVGAIGRPTLIGAGIQGIEYNVENTNSDGTVYGSWSWSGYGENLGIGGATGLVSGGVGVARRAAVVLRSARRGRGERCLQPVLDQRRERPVARDQRRGRRGPRRRRGRVLRRPLQLRRR